MAEPEVSEIKKEIVTDGSAAEKSDPEDEKKGKPVQPASHEQKSDDDSEDDVPLSFLDKTKFKESKELKRSYTVSASEENTNGEKKVKKLKIKLEKPDEESEDLSCQECQKTFKSSQRLHSHMRKAHERAFSCFVCPKTFRKRSHLDKHIANHTGEKPYGCYLCKGGEFFRTEYTLNMHMKTAHPNDPKDRKMFPCAHCNKVLHSSISLEEHTRLHTGVKPVSCHVCKKEFVRVRDLKQHLNIHEEAFKCEQCQKCFLSQFKLNEHMRSHTGEMPYECDKCDRKFARIADYRYHIGTHLGLKPYACNLCGMRFTTSSSVTRHRLNVHPTGPEQFTCEHCPKTFHTETRLKTHTQAHLEKMSPKLHYCKQCPATRNTASALTKHMVTHNGAFRCDTCHRGCPTAENLAAHVLRHEMAGKAYACFVCRLGYTTPQSLNKHLARVHKDEDLPRIAPQHLCTLCGDIFEQKEKLNRHLKENHTVLVIGEISNIVEEEEEENDVMDMAAKLEVTMDVGEQELDSMAEETLQENVEFKENVEETNANEMIVETIDVPAIKTPEVVKEIKVVEAEIEIEKIVERKELNEVVKEVKENKEREESFIEDKVKLVEDVDIKKDLMIEDDIETSVIHKNVSSLTITDLSQVSGIVNEGNTKDFSAASTALFSDMKPIKSQSVHPKSNYDMSAYMRNVYNDSLQQNQIIQNSYMEDVARSRYDGYTHMQAGGTDVMNPWLLSAKMNEINQSKLLTKGNAEARQRYNDLKMPRLDSLPNIPQQDYRSNLNRTRHEVNPEASMSNSNKYYYHENQERSKQYADNFNLQRNIEESRKYVSSLQNHLVDRQNPRDLASHQSFQPLSVRDFSNPSEMQNSPFSHPSTFAAMTASPHNFFRDLQHRMLANVPGIHNYGHTSRHDQTSVMDMSSQRHGSPISPYNPNSQMTLENLTPSTLSPMSRNSFEDLPTSHGNNMNNATAYQNNSANRNTGNLNSGNVSTNQNKEGNNPNNEQNMTPFEMRVAAS